MIVWQRTKKVISLLTKILGFVTGISMMLGNLEQRFSLRTCTCPVNRDSVFFIVCSKPPATSHWNPNGIKLKLQYFYTLDLKLQHKEDRSNENCIKNSLYKWVFRNTKLMLLTVLTKLVWPSCRNTVLILFIIIVMRTMIRTEAKYFHTRTPHLISVFTASNLSLFLRIKSIQSLRTWRCLAWQL